jgi:hypothetical protein
MRKLARGDLLSLEEYADQRKEFRSRMIEHKRYRNVSLGPNLRLYFEDRQTVQYQIQEMLRIEKIFEAEGINDELETYNPLIPDGSNLKATMMIEFENVEERRHALARLVGVENTIWIKVDDTEKIFAIANEDLERSTAEKTSAVHFLRFEFTPQQVQLAKAGAQMVLGVDHVQCAQQVSLDENCRLRLVADFE